MTESDNRQAKGGEADGARKYPKPWLAADPPKQRAMAEEVKGQVSEL